MFLQMSYMLWFSDILFLFFKISRFRTFGFFLKHWGPVRSSRYKQNKLTDASIASYLLGFSIVVTATIPFFSFFPLRNHRKISLLSLPSHVNKLTTISYCLQARRVLLTSPLSFLNFIYSLLFFSFEDQARQRSRSEIRLLQAEAAYTTRSFPYKMTFITECRWLLHEKEVVDERREE